METTKFDEWLLELGPHLSGAEARRVRAFIRVYRGCFAFSLEDLEGYESKLFTFSWKMITQSFGNLTGLVSQRKLAS